MKTQPGSGVRLWPVLAVLLGAVLVPTACVLWFMNAALHNQRLATRQRLTEAYQGHLASIRKALDERWQAKAEAVERAAAAEPALAFAELVTLGVADSVVVYDDSGRVAYPNAPRAAPEPTGPGAAEWRDARRLEADGDLAAAAKAYGRAAAAADEAALAARALQARARCLLRTQRREEAVAALKTLTTDPRYAAATDAEGRFIAPSAELLLLETYLDLRSPEWPSVVRSLRDRLADYRSPTMPAAQRVFLMERLIFLNTNVAFPTLPAERLARDCLDTAPSAAPEPGLRPLEDGRLWTLTSSDRRVAALFEVTTITVGAAGRIAADQPLSGAMLTLHPGSSEGMGWSRTYSPFLTVPVGSHMPGWGLTLSLDINSPFLDQAARRQRAAYFWTAGLGIAAIVALAMVVAGHLARQARLTRLKNDLIATVSHELKTPLASMRVLVDTLLAGRAEGEKQATEYLELISRENERLSRLIDNFLTFSRMERNKRAFEREPVDVGEVVRAAAESARERFAAPGCRLGVEIAKELPPVEGDRDALLTVLLNLLDNAWKYTGEDKEVTVAARAEDGDVRVSVADNGMGMTRRQTRRIFESFYQADRRLSRSAQGCGLGLSIVKFIVDAHGGSVDVDSRPGHGSTFTVRLPAAGPGEEG